MHESRSDIRKILMVLLASVAAAFLLTTFFVTRYGPSGDYNLDTALLKPDILKQLNYNDLNPKTGSQDRYIFDRIVVESGKNSHPIDLKTYGKMYALLNGDKSILPTPEMVVAFVDPAIILSLFVKTESPASWQFDSKMVQKIEFFENMYRVLLHEEAAGTHWVYFEHPHVLSQIKQALNL